MIMFAINTFCFSNMTLYACLLTGTLVAGWYVVEDLGCCTGHLCGVLVYRRFQPRYVNTRL